MKNFRPQSLGKYPQDEVKKTSKKTPKNFKTPEPPQAPKAPMVRYSDEELANFKVIVEEKLAIAKANYNAASTRLLELKTDEPRDTGDNASLASSMTEITEEKNSASKLKNCLEKALIRIGNKSYGIDRETGKLISKERLLLVPHATLSVDSKNNNAIH